MRFRHYFHFGIFMVWMVCMVLLHQRVSSRTFLDSKARVDVTDGAVVLRQDDMTIYLGGVPSGVSNFMLERRPAADDSTTTGNVLAYKSSTVMRLGALGADLSVRITAEGILNEDLTLRSLKSEFSSLDSSVKTESVVEGNRIHTKFYSKDTEEPKEIPIDGPVYVPDVMHLVVAKQGLRAGKSYQLPGFDPITQTVGAFNVMVKGPRTVQTAKGPVSGIQLDSIYQKITTTLVIDNDANIFYQEANMAGIQFISVRDEEAKHGILPSPSVGEQSEPVDLLAQSLTESNVIIDRPQDVKEMIVSMQPIEPSEVVQDGYSQRILKNDARNKTIKLEIRSPHYGSGAASPPINAQLYLQSEPLIQVKDPRIVTRAKQIVGSSSNPWNSAEKIAEWLHDRIDKSPRATIPSAIEVLESMKGDCNEHSILFCALARSIGIPTKICAGLVYLNGQFGYHAWNEVWIGNRWLPIDSTLGRIKMDAAHIKLVEGGLDKWLPIAHLVGSLQIRIESYK